ncbi:hypothetical protein B0H11DRAFT_1899512 [Mycena galericulata]|nr:hypothetical protein B0H11DRAFT_1899512 [Mycena galericulata]
MLKRSEGERALKKVVRGPRTRARRIHEALAAGERRHHAKFGGSSFRVVGTVMKSDSDEGRSGRHVLRRGLRGSSFRGRKTVTSVTPLLASATMPLRALTSWLPSTDYADETFRSRWAQSLDGDLFPAETAIQVDDIVTLGLFSRIADKPPSRQFFPELFSQTGAPIDLEVITQFRRIVDDMQDALFRPTPTLEQFERDTVELGRRIWKWGQNKLNLSGDKQGRKALLWALRAYLPLIAPWSAVHLKVVRMGRTRTPGFGIVAQRDIAAGEYLHELIALVTPNFTARQSNLSQIYCPKHGTEHIFWGPLRMINHDCRPNWVEVEGSRAMVIAAVRPIRFGEELLADYGLDFWEYCCPCLTCSVNAPGSSSFHPAPLSNPRYPHGPFNAPGPSSSNPMPLSNPPFPRGPFNALGPSSSNPTPFSNAAGPFSAGPSAAVADAAETSGSIPSQSRLNRIRSRQLRRARELDKKNKNVQ